MAAKFDWLIKPGLVRRWYPLWIHKASLSSYNITKLLELFSVLYKSTFCIAVIRTLTGHKANIRCLDIHPYGDFVVSGSADTFVKVWCIPRCD